MIALILAAALARDPAPCPPPAAPYIADVGERGDETSYLCLIETDAFRDPLVAAIDAAPPDDPALPRYTRALALHLAARAEDPFDASLVRRLNPADRRLLADAIKARRGRKSPSEEHDAIFHQQWWYRADKTYSDNELSKVDRDNIAMANDPPEPAPEPEPEPAAAIDPVAAAPSAATRGCGCSAEPIATGANSGLVAALACVLATTRRRSR